MQVVFLKGVNVGGHKTFKPRLLAKQLKAYDVVNVGAAGTFVVRNNVKPTVLRKELERRLPVECEIMICAGAQLRRLRAQEPFARYPAGKDTVRFVMVLAARPRARQTLPLNVPTKEWIVKLLAIEGRFAFGLYRRHMRAIRYLGELEKRFGIPGTTRNWNTLEKIFAILDSR